MARMAYTKGGNIERARTAMCRNLSHTQWAGGPGRPSECRRLLVRPLNRILQMRALQQEAADSPPPVVHASINTSRCKVGQ